MSRGRYIRKFEKPGREWWVARAGDGEQGYVHGGPFQTEHAARLGVYAALQHRRRVMGFYRFARKVVGEVLARSWKSMILEAE